MLNLGSLITRDEGVVGGEGLTVVNRGLIDAGDKGIDADDLDNVRVTNFATIKAGDKAIRIGVGNHAVVVNTGLITGGDEAVEAGDQATITNTGEIISNEDDGIQVGENAVIINTGTIRSLGGKQDAIDLDSGVVQNLAGAEITSQTDAAIDFDASEISSKINNFGTIKGVLGILVENDPEEGANTASQGVENWGHIEGTGGTALNLGAGNDAYIHHAGAVLIGAADFGAGADQLILKAPLSHPFAGGAVMSGGDGVDTVIFSLPPEALSKVAVIGDVTTLYFSAGHISLSGWERFDFKGVTLSLSEVQNLD